MANDKTTAVEETKAPEETKTVETPVVDTVAAEAPAETSEKDVSNEQALPEAEVQETTKEETQAAAKAPETKVAQPQQKTNESPRQKQASQALHATKVQTTQTLAEPMVVSPQVKKIDPATVNTPAPAPKSTQQVVPAVNRGGYEGDPYENEKNYLDKLSNEGTLIQKRILAAVQALYNGIAPKAPIKPNEGAAVQERFLGHVLSLMDKSQEEFNQGWNVLLLFFLAYHDVKGGNSLRGGYTAISEYRAADFGKNWRDFNAFEDYKKIIHILRETRNRDTRKQNMKNISLATFMSNSTNFTEERINKLRNFYDN